jgi:hypothetical protein
LALISGELWWTLPPKVLKSMLNLLMVAVSVQQDQGLVPPPKPYHIIKQTWVCHPDVLLLGDLTEQVPWLLWVLFSSMVDGKEYLSP